MRSIFLLGGFCGFCLVLVGGWVAGRPLSLVLRDAAIACLVMALLFRWVWNLIVKSFHETATIRKARLLQAEMAADEAAAASAALSPRTTPGGLAPRPVSNLPPAPVPAGRR